MARNRARFTRPQPRTKMWIGAGTGSTSVVGSSIQLIGTLSAGALLLRPFTILRTRMQLDVRSDQETAIEHVIASYGRIVVTDTAAAIGATAVPDPSGISGDPEADWYVWQALANTFFIDINGTDGIGVSTLANRTVIDSKAMRKVGPDDNVVSMVGNELSTGFQLTSNGRMLIQLH